MIEDNTSMYRLRSIVSDHKIIMVFEYGYIMSPIITWWDTIYEAEGSKLGEFPWVDGAADVRTMT